MTLSKNSISSYYVTTALSGVARVGMNTQDLLDKAGLNGVLIDQDYCLASTNRLPTSSVSSLIRAIWQESNDEFMGLTDQPCKQGVFSLMAKQLIRCATLRDALSWGANFYHLTRNDISFEFHENKHEAILTFKLTKPELDEDHFLVEFFLLVWHRFASWLVRQKIPLKYANFAYSSPSHVPEYSLLFPCHCRFNQARNSIAIDKSFLDMAVQQRDKELTMFLQNSPEDLLARPVFYATFSTQVMNVMLRQGECSYHDIESLADYFSISSRHLRRRLKVEGTSYQEIKNNLRSEQAQAWLRDGQFSINKIAMKCGFTEPAAFTRAFKSWTGVSPKVYRARL
jgi:AraC-like DNA-binding protein